MTPDDLAAAHLETARSVTIQQKIAGDDERFDDLVQEGAMAAWLQTKDRDLASPIGYGLVAARRRIIGTIIGKHPMYGSEAEPGRRIHDQYRQRERRVVAEEGLPDLPGHRDPYVEVERRVDLERALGDLDARDLLIAGMVGRGYTWEEIADAVELTKDGAWNRWRRILKPMLVERLQAA